MMRDLLLGCALLLAACDAGPAPQAPVRADLAAEVIRSDTPPKAEPDECWSEDTTPAVIETVTEQVLVTPATTAPDGTPVKAVYGSVTQQKIVRDRERIWFRTPCPEELTIEVIATLQRALKARGLYRDPLTGQLDAPTRAAVRRFQAPLGLDSPVLSLAAARNLGIIAVDLGLDR